MVLKTLKEGISEFLFPKVCVVCGLKLTTQEHFVCIQCLNDKFEIAYSKGNYSSSEIILPEGVISQHALWNFDKGGYLQELLHKLKYQRLTGIGEDIGRQLGKSLLNNSGFMEWVRKENSVLLPVPLHPQKRRMRGYNQAFYISKGVSEVIGMPILKKNVVKRIRNTGTQTGFSLEKRRKNMDGAFSVMEPDVLKDQIIIIIDDVFTTGATTFELSSELQKAGCGKIMIATVAQA